MHTEESKHDDETFMVVSDEVPAYSRWLTSGGTPDNGLYGEALPERGFRLRVYKRVGISLIEVYQRGGKSDISVCKRPNGARGSYILWLRKNLENVLVSWFIHILKTVIYSSCKGCNFLNVVSERGTICPIQIYKRETFSVQK